MEQWQMLTGELELILNGYNKGRVFYYTPYYAGRGYSSSAGTSDIQNFKKPVDRRGMPEWWYREEAIVCWCQLRHPSLDRVRIGTIV